MGISILVGIKATALFLLFLFFKHLRMPFFSIPILYSSLISYLISIASHPFVNLPLLLGKSSDGTFPLWSKLLFGPFLVFVHLFVFSRRMMIGEPLFAEISEGLFVGGWPSSLEHLPPGDPAVIDCTCELSRPSTLSHNPYICIATWDTRAPKPFQIESAVRWSLKKRALKKPLYIHCAYAAVLSTCYWLPETLHIHPESKSETLTTETLEASFHCSEVKVVNEDFEGTDAVSNENLFMNWPLMSSIIAYCVFSLHDMAYTEIFPLWAESGWKYGGLCFSSQDVGGVLAISGFSLLVFQLFFYPPLEKLIGHVNLCRAAAILAIPLTASYPFMTKLSGFELTLIVNGASILKNVLSMAIITGLFILQNNAVSQCQRGAANGISMTGQSMFKAIAPAAAGAIFSWAQKHQNSSFLPGNHMVFLILNLVLLVGLLMTFKPFLAYSTEGRK